MLDAHRPAAEAAARRPVSRLAAAVIVAVWVGLLALAALAAALALG